jgi:hypothetical protein
MTHSYMLSDVLQILLGDVAFVLCFLAPGYLTARLTNVMQFRSLSLAEKALWSVALSGPISIVLCCLAGRFVSPGLMVALFLLLGTLVAAGIAMELWQARHRWQQEFSRTFWIVSACMLVVALYCLFATLGIETSHSLYESIVAADWSIRVPLVEAAVRAGIPPHNPMFAIGGHAPAMRYYYFWYELCAQVVRLTHISARNCLAASTVWSAYSLVAVTFLYLKYLSQQASRAPIFLAAQTSQTAQAPQQNRGSHLQQVCLLALGLMCVMGLDLVNAVVGLFAHPVQVYPDIEAWRPDRMPSWPGSILFAPHHMAGLAFAALGFLLLAILPAQPKQKLVHALLAALCFTALVGTSTYLALCIAIAGGFLVVVKALGRSWADIGCILLSGVVALLLSLPFLHEMTSTVAYAAAEHPKAGAARSLLSNQMFKVVLSCWHMAFGIIGTFAHEHNLPYEHLRIRYLFPLMLLPVLYAMSLSFYLFVLWYQAKADFRGPQRPQQRALVLWALALGFALPALLLSSEPTQGINDLGRHAGLALRLVLIVWAAPMMLNTWHRLRTGTKPNRAGRWVVSLTAVAIVLGLGGQLWQITMDRIYLPLIAHDDIGSMIQYQQGAPFLQVRRANDAVAANLPSNAIVQSDPVSRYQSIFLLYLNRQTAAGDEGCEAAFGGNVDLCKQQVFTPLQALFGGDIEGRPIEPGEAPQAPPDPANMTDARFRATCRELHLSALLATSVDAAWSIPGTWVWTEPTLYADNAVRVIRCPK